MSTLKHNQKSNNSPAVGATSKQLEDFSTCAQLTDDELKTLLAMAEASKTIGDARDTISLYACLPESLKPQLRQALRGLPAAIKKLLSAAANSQQGRAAA